MNKLVNPSSISAVVVAAAFMVSSGSAFAVDLKLKLTGAEESPPVTTSASGTGTITIAADKSVSGTIKTTGIDGTVAHIHVGVFDPPHVSHGDLDVQLGFGTEMAAIASGQRNRAASYRVGILHGAHHVG